MRNYSDPFKLVLILILAAFIFHLIFDLVSLVLLSNKYYELGFAFIFHIPNNICPYDIIDLMKIPIPIRSNIYIHLKFQ